MPNDKTTTLLGAEYWVMEIILDQRSIKKLGQAVVAMRFGMQLAAGRLVYINGEIVEPIECLEDQEDALIAAQRRTQLTGKPCKVVLNVDV